MSIRRTNGRALLAGAAMLACAQLASASFIQGTITGGLAGNGVDLSSGTVVYAAAAVNNISLSSYAIQGVTFTTMASTSGVTVAGSPTPYDETAPAYADESNDPLDQVMKGVEYKEGTFTVTCDVTSGQTYSLELLLQEVNDGTGTYTDREFYVALSGADTVSATLITLPTAEKGGNTGVSETEDFTAQSDSLVMTFTEGPSPAGVDFAPAVNAFVLTAAPEPGSLSILGLGAIGLLARRRRARR